MNVRTGRYRLRAAGLLLAASLVAMGAESQETVPAAMGGPVLTREAPGASESGPATQTPASVRATPPDPQLDALVAEALQMHPDVARANALVLAAQARVEPAGALPDPFLGTTYQVEGSNFGLGSMPDTWLGFMYSQPLPWPGKRGLEKQVAESDAKALGAGLVGRTALSIEADVRRSYYDLVLARSILQLIEERRQSWKQIEGVVRERYSVGLGAQQDVLRAQVELLRIDEAVAAQQAIVESRIAALNYMTGRPPNAPLETAQKLVPRQVELDSASVLEAVWNRSPEIAAARQSIETGQLRVSSAHKAYKPDFVVSGGPMYRGDLDPMWQVGFGVSLPLFSKSKQDYRLREAEELASASNSELQSIVQTVALRTRERLANLEAAQKVAKLYSEGVIPLDELSFESAIASYQTGKLPFISVLEALNSLYGDRETLLSRSAEIETWLIAIDEASLQPSGGGMPASGGGASMSSGNSSNSGAGMSGASGQTDSSSSTSMR
ncbi:MAG: TolC family protein [Thermoanaerobaculia bacterium]|jgi:outer membrane protein TolC